MEAKRAYFLGLDLGTGSVGWCVTDTKYHILKANRKRTIGSYFFSTADTAKDKKNCAVRKETASETAGAASMFTGTVR